MNDQSTYQDLLNARNNLEKKVRQLKKELKEYLSSYSKPDINNIFFQLFNRTNNIVLLHKNDLNNLPGKIIMVNAAAKKVLGYTEEEFKKMTFSSFFDSKTLKKPSPESQIKEIFKYERTLLTKNKKKIYAEIHTHQFEHKGERYAFTIIHDITERKNATEALRANEEKYKRLVESLRDEYFFYSRDIKGMITYVSPSIKKVLGYSRDEALRNYKEFLTDHEMNKKSLQYLELGLGGEKQPPFLNELYHRDGSTRIFYNTEIPVFDESGQVFEIEGIARDITDAIKSEEQLKNQEERFRLLVETIEEVFWIFDLKKDKLLYISPKFEKVYGRTCESLYIKPGSFLKTVHPNDVSKVKKAYKQIEKGKGFDLEYRIRYQDNSIKWIWSRSFIVEDDKKKPSFVVGIAFDITDRKIAQRDINLLVAIVENTEDHAVIKDINLRIIASNRANTKAAGKKRAEELIGKTDLELYGDHPHVRQYMEDDRKAMAMKKGEFLVNEQIFVFPDGKTIYSLVKKFPVFDEKNNLIAVASISRDITELKKVLQDLSESEKKYRYLVENQEEGIGITDMNCKFTFINPSTERIFGSEKGKLIGKSLMQFFDKETGKKITEKLKGLKRNEKQSYEIDIIDGHGKAKTIHVTATPQYLDGRQSGIFLVIMDFSHWKEIERNLLKSQKELGDANASKDKLFSIIAHDLKNPFHSILNFSDLLLKHYQTYDKEEILTFIKMIHESSTQAYSLLENLLNWSRAQTNRINIEPSVTDLYSIVTDTINLLEGIAKGKNINIINNVTENTLAYCDRNMISIVIRNLLSNAIKFTRPAGKVTFSSKTKTRTCELSVTDTGVGIKQEDMKKLFRIDTHFSTAGTANEEGTGLGLILCNEFVNLNNGTLNVKSKPNKGSTFIIELQKTAGSTRIK